MTEIINWFINLGVWSFASFWLVIFGLVTGYVKLIRTKSSIDNFIIRFGIERAEGWLVPYRITVGFFNHTGHSAQISNATFKYNKLDSGPAIKDSQTGLTPVKFPGLVRTEAGNEILLVNFDSFLKSEDSTYTYFPLDAVQKDQDVKNVFLRGKAGIFKCYITLLPRNGKPIVHRIRIVPKDKIDLNII
ncbi:hypothetical protein KKI24_27310 [bacterium]|nr:hypothetical protein [bacterium]